MPKIRIILEERKSIIKFDIKLWVRKDTSNHIDTTMVKTSSAEITDVVVFTYQIYRMNCQKSGVVYIEKMHNS